MSNLAATVWTAPNVVIAIVVLNAVAPTDAEWESFAHIVDANVEAPNSHSLALTDGGGPNATQRARINAILGRVPGKRLFSAVVTESLMIRGVVGALRLFHRHTETFSAAQIRDAMRFIGVPESQWGSLWTAVVSTDAKISPRSRIVESGQRFLSPMEKR